MPKTKNRRQQILNDAGGSHMKVIDKDHVQIVVDDEKEVFSRWDEVSGSPFSGLRHFGSVYGDHRMIDAIAEDIQAAFKIIDKEVTNG